MSSILQQLADYARERTQAQKQIISPGEMKEKALSLPKGSFEFEKALRSPQLSFICECKKASPSKGIISHDFPYLKIANQYMSAGADCISVLTEPKWFLGRNEYLTQISQAVDIPCLRKDFTVDEYMIYQAKILGAKAVLLICSILSAKQIKKFIGIADTLGISALVEAHNSDEVKTALDCGARIVGVNNRDLRDFSVDTKNSSALRSLVPKDVLFVSESGINTAEDVRAVKQAGADAVLIGEALMRAPDISEKLRELKGV
ncbi:MAG: indole-3-glycerol phosphate synthase TrpC [Ruminococcus sp.]|nr:indole-3-glycerol phosphate synthase TrpC [Ruminococcus sp.]